MKCGLPKNSQFLPSRKSARVCCIKAGGAIRTYWANHNHRRFRVSWRAEVCSVNAHASPSSSTRSARKLEAPPARGRGLPISAAHDAPTVTCTSLSTSACAKAMSTNAASADTTGRLMLQRRAAPERSTISAMGVVAARSAGAALSPTNGNSDSLRVGRVVLSNVTAVFTVSSKCHSSASAAAGFTSSRHRLIALQPQQLNQLLRQAGSF